MAAVQLVRAESLPFRSWLGIWHTCQFGQTFCWPTCPKNMWIFCLFLALLTTSSRRWHNTHVLKSRDNFHLCLSKTRWSIFDFYFKEARNLFLWKSSWENMEEISIVCEGQEWDWNESKNEPRVLTFSSVKL